MTTINEIKAEREKKYSENITACGMFFAFSNEQFDENKTPLQSGDKYVSIGSGGYLPKTMINKWLEGCKLIDKWYKDSIKSAKLRYANIAYELSNHEAYYTGDIQDTLDSLGGDYTRDEVLAVYHKEKAENLQDY